MSNRQSKILKNVFLSTENNKLKLVDIYFSDKIEKVVDRISSEIEWNEINSLEKRNRVTNQISEFKYPSGSKIYDGEFFVLIPGAIDSHVHFDTPGFEDRDDFEHGSTAAAFGGVTTVIDMPCTSLPPVTNKNNFDIKLNVLKNRSLVDYGFYGGVCGNDFDKNLNIESQIQDLSDKGVAVFKTYEPAFNVPEYTLKNASLPTKGSVAILKAIAHKGASSEVSLFSSASVSGCLPVTGGTSNGDGK